MKTNRLIGTIALSLTAFSLLVDTASPARSEPVAQPLTRSLYDCSSAVSLIVVPNGRCFNLTYLSAPTQSGQNASQNSTPVVLLSPAQPSHRAVMHEISRAFASRRPLPPLTLQQLGLAK